jgi:amino-acid N-acetyltransferase
MTIRKAELRDIPAIFEMIKHYAEAQVMLPRSLTDLYESVREFQVAEDAAGNLVGCGALKLYNADLAEVRSLCVDPHAQRRGAGKSLTEGLLAEARGFGVKNVFALTTIPDFFARYGFREAARERFPMKLWRDCLRCDRYYHCEETAVWLDLSLSSSAPSRPVTDPVEVPV